VTRARPATAHRSPGFDARCIYNFAATNGPADFWLMLGDNAYNSGTDVEHQRAIFDMYPTTLRNLFLWPTIGNHETSQSFTATDFPYLHIFSLPKEGEAGGVPSGTEKYYSFDYGNIHFVCLDSMTSGRSATNAMGLWLQSDLAAATAEWIVVFFHHPPYTKGNHDSDRESELIELRENLLPILETNGVDLVLCGHSHAWERSYLLNGHYGLSSTLTEAMKIDGGDGREDGDGAYRKNQEGQGVVYTVTGNAGQVTGGSLDHVAHFLSLNELGTMVIDINGNRLDAIFLRETGEIQDRFTITKPSPAPAAPLNLVAMPTTPTEIALMWAAGSTNQLGYSVERSTDGVNFTEVFTAPADATGVNNSGLILGLTYFYRVRATNSIGASDYSNIASITAVAASETPRGPAALTASADNGVEFYRSQMILRWQDRSTNEAGFRIERSLNGAPYVPVATVGANASYFLDRNLPPPAFMITGCRPSTPSGFPPHPTLLAMKRTSKPTGARRRDSGLSCRCGRRGTHPLSVALHGPPWRGKRTKPLSLTAPNSRTKAIQRCGPGCHRPAGQQPGVPLRRGPARNCHGAARSHRTDRHHDDPGHHRRWDRALDLPMAQKRQSDCGRHRADALAPEYPAHRSGRLLRDRSERFRLRHQSCGDGFGLHAAHRRSRDRHLDRGVEARSGHERIQRSECAAAELQLLPRSGRPDQFVDRPDLRRIPLDAEPFAGARDQRHHRGRRRCHEGRGK
jgi:hypothetical protein